MCFEEVGVGEVGLRVTHAGVPAAATVVVLAPGDRVLDTVGAGARGVGGLVHRGQDVELVPGGEGVGSAEVVPLVRTLPALRQARGGGVCRVLDLDGRGRGAVRVVVEVGTDQVAVPRPVVLGVGGRVDAGVAAAGLDVALERRLLGRGEHVTGGGEEDDDLVLLEVGVVEDAAVLGHGHREVVGDGELLDRGRRLVDVGVAERGSLGEDQRVEPLGCARPAPLPRRPCQQSRARTRAESSQESCPSCRQPSGSTCLWWCAAAPRRPPPHPCREPPPGAAPRAWPWSSRGGRVSASAAA